MLITVCFQPYSTWNGHQAPKRPSAAKSAPFWTPPSSSWRGIPSACPPIAGLWRHSIAHIFRARGQYRLPRQCPFGKGSPPPCSVAWQKVKFSKKTYRSFSFFVYYYASARIFAPCQIKCWSSFMEPNFLGCGGFELVGPGSRIIRPNPNFLHRKQRGLVGSALACCKAGPSSNLGSAPHGGSAHWADSYEEMEMGLSECLWMKDVWLCACIYCIV